MKMILSNKLEKIHYVYGWRNLLDNNFFYIGVGKYQKLSLSKSNRKEVEYNGIIYPSKKALARFLGICSKSLKYKIDHKKISVKILDKNENRI